MRVKTHFDIFGLTPSVDLDAKALDQKYRALSLELHPDRNPDNRVHAAERTAALNKAYKVLKDPTQRAFYLLALNGVDLEKEDTAAQGAKLGLGMDFLESILDQREVLDQARQNKDAAKARQMGEGISTEMEQALEQANQKLRDPSADNVKAATTLLAKVRYYQRFLEEVDAISEGAAS